MESGVVSIYGRDLQFPFAMGLLKEKIIDFIYIKILSK